MKSKILMLEHDQDDRFISKEFFIELGNAVTIDFVANSTELLSHLLVNAKSNLPSLILLSQHASPISALTLIKEIKTHAEYQYIPIVVVGDGSGKDFTREFYEAGACSFIQKPATYADTKMKIESFIQYWFQTVELS